MYFSGFTSFPQHRNGPLEASGRTPCWVPLLIVVFVAGPKALMSFVVSDWDSYTHVDSQMKVL